jgi:hypothetical protein
MTQYPSAIWRPVLPGGKGEAHAAIPGQHLSALISMSYIFGFRKNNAIFFNDLGQNHPDRVSPKRLCH